MCDVGTNTYCLVVGGGRKLGAGASLEELKLTRPIRVKSWPSTGLEAIDMRCKLQPSPFFFGVSPKNTSCFRCVVALQIAEPPTPDPGVDTPHAKTSGIEVKVQVFVDRASRNSRTTTPLASLAYPTHSA